MLARVWRRVYSYSFMHAAISIRLDSYVAMQLHVAICMYMYYIAIYQIMHVYR